MTYPHTDLPHEEDGQDWTRAIIATLCLYSLFIGALIGFAAGYLAAGL